MSMPIRTFACLAAIAAAMTSGGCGGDPAPAPTVQVAPAPPPPVSLRPPSADGPEARTSAIERVRAFAERKYPGQLSLDDVQASWMSAASAPVAGSRAIPPPPGGALTPEQRAALDKGRSADESPVAPPPNLVRQPPPPAEAGAGAGAGRWRIMARVLKPAAGGGAEPPLVARVFDVGRDGTVTEAEGLRAPREALAPSR